MDVFKGIKGYKIPRIWNLLSLYKRYNLLYYNVIHVKGFDL